MTKCTCKIEYGPWWLKKQTVAVRELCPNCIVEIKKLAEIIKKRRKK